MCKHIVTCIKPLNKKKLMVYIDEEKAFSLYKSEINKYNIHENEDIDDESIAVIYKDVLYPRAKERALNLLEKSVKTEGEIAAKLREGGYPEEIIAKVTDFLKEYRYIDDVWYAKTYYSEKRKSKSRYVICAELRKKGIPDDIIKEACEEIPIDETENIIKAMKRKNISVDNADYKQKSKVIASFMRQGYRYDNIISAFNRIGIDMEYE